MPAGSKKCIMPRRKRSSSMSFNPTRILGDEDGNVTSIECIDMELGRQMPRVKTTIPIKGSEKQIEVDTVIVAIGQSPNPLIKSTTKV